MIEKGMRRIVTALALAAVVASPAWSEFKPKVSAQGGAVVINGRVAARFRTSNGSLSPASRAQITAERLARLASQRAAITSIFAKGNRYQARVMAGESMICIVTRQEAKLARTTTVGLAASWAANMRTLLLMPPIVLSDRQLVVPLGENRRVVVTGAATGPITAKSDCADVATAAPGADGRYVQVTGNQVGQATVSVEVEGESALVNVFVKKYAGGVPSSGFAEVTGSPCPAGLVAYAASHAALRSAAVEPDAEAKVERIEGADTSLGERMTRQVKVQVSITGPGYIDYENTCVVETHNSMMPPDEVYQLFYSNKPERFTRYQELFAGKLQPDKATRILYHHQNAVGKRARLLIELVNPTPSHAVFRVYRGVSAPLVDTVLVGYIASAGFLKDQFYNASVIERVPPQSRLVLVSDVLGNQETSSGILQVRQTSASGAYVRIAAIPPEIDSSPVGAIGPAPESVALQLSDHIYAAPWKTLEVGYTVGKQWAFIPIGKQPIDSHDAQRKLDGNYGVTYDIRVKVENPTDREKKVQVVFDPTAGLASGVFIIDGSFVSAKYARPPAEVPLATYKLKPGEVRNVTIVTLPLAGSNYPATLVVRS